MANKIIVIFHDHVSKEDAGEILKKLACSYEHHEVIETYLITVSETQSIDHLMNELRHYPEVDKCALEGNFCINI